MLELELPRTFLKELKKAKKRNCDLEVLNYAIILLRKNQPLPLRYRDHKLVGNYQGCRECHLKPDWLLIYKIIGSKLILLRTGTHSDLFD